MGGFFRRALRHSSIYTSKFNNLDPRHRIGHQSARAEFHTLTGIRDSLQAAQPRSVEGLDASSADPFNLKELLHSEAPVQRILESVGQLVTPWGGSIAEEFQRSAGVWESSSINTLGKHHEMVLLQHRRHFRGLAAPGMDGALFELTLALHDAGKAAAIRYSNKDAQHEFTSQLLDSVRSSLPVNDIAFERMKALIDGDPIGQMLMGRLQPKTAAEKVGAMAAKARLSPVDFFKLLTRYYQVDASSYTIEAGAERPQPGRASMNDVFVVGPDGVRLEFDAPKARLMFSPRNEALFSELENLVAQLPAPRLSSSSVRQPPQVTTTLPPGLVRVNLELRGNLARVQFSVDPALLEQFGNAEVVPGLRLPPTTPSEGDWLDLGESIGHHSVELRREGIPGEWTHQTLLFPYEGSIDTLHQTGIAAYVDFFPDEGPATRAWVTSPGSNVFPSLPDWQPAGARRHLMSIGGSTMSLNGKPRELMSGPPAAFSNIEPGALLSKLPESLRTTHGHALTFTAEEGIPMLKSGEVVRSPMAFFHGTTASQANSIIHDAGPGGSSEFPRIQSGFFTTGSKVHAATFSAFHIQKARAPRVKSWRWEETEQANADELVVLEAKVPPHTRVIDIRTHVAGSDESGFARRAFEYFRTQVESGKLRFPQLEALEAEMLARNSSLLEWPQLAKQTTFSEQAFAHLMGAQVLLTQGWFTNRKGETVMVDEQVVLDPRLIEGFRWFNGDQLPAGIKAWQ